MTVRDAPKNPWRIVVAGGGIAGLALALALKRSLGSALEVVVCDPALGRDPSGDRRAYAVAAGARRMLTSLGIWQALAGGAQPILDMIVTDSRLSDPVRPIFLTFAGEVEPGEAFAHMVESGHLTAALVAACRNEGVDLRPAAIVGCERGLDAVLVEVAGGEAIEAALLVAADGARSRLREEAGIGWVAWDYPQAAIVGTVAHERDHEGRAVEHFLPSGPFAILPLTPGGVGSPLPHRSSIVWTEAGEAVPYLLALGPDDQAFEVERRFGLQLGSLTLESPLRSHPLAFGMARAFRADRMALLGDAAHVIHPIAGQGLNLGLTDAAALAEAVADAVRLGLDPGGEETLSRYERARRFDTLTMGMVTDGLNRLFSNDLLPVRLVRDLGLGLVDRMPALKGLFMRRAAGLGGGQPKLMRGEAL